eukprot:g5751.t1
MKKRSRQDGAASSVEIAVKAEEEEECSEVTGGSSSTTRGNSKRARPVEFTLLVAAAVKAEKTPKGEAISPTTSSAFLESVSESEVAAETESVST